MMNERSASAVSHWVPDSMGHHHHHHGSSIDGQSRRLWATIGINIGITLLLFVGGAWSNSLSVVSDALHNLSDVFSLLVSLFAIRLKKRQVSWGKTFGYQRAEIIAALVNAASLLAIAGFLCIEAVGRFVRPDTLDGQLVMVLASVSIVANALSAWILFRDAQHSLNMRSAYLHLLSDAMSSVAVLLGGLAVWQWQVYWVDSVLAIGIACYLVYSSWDLLMGTLKILMQFAPDHLDWDSLDEDIRAYPGIANIHHVHVWQLTDTRIHLEAHVDFHKDVKLSEAMKAIEGLKEMLATKYGITHVVLQPEFRDQSRDAGLVPHHCDQESFRRNR